MGILIAAPNKSKFVSLNVMLQIWDLPCAVRLRSVQKSHEDSVNRNVDPHGLLRSSHTSAPPNLGSIEALLLRRLELRSRFILFFIVRGRGPNLPYISYSYLATQLLEAYLAELI